MKICSLLNQKNIVLGLECGKKEDVLRNFVTILTDRGLLTKPEKLLEKILERERLGSTALEQEMAIPHALTSDIEKTFLALAVLEDEVDFGTDKSKPVSILFLLLGNEDNPGQQLKVLAHICRLTKETKVIRKIRKSRSVHEICEEIDKEESKIA
jgi:mannitol/fructose-specific phosphotransferase system IIA component (Ntr-type)